MFEIRIFHSIYYNIGYYGYLITRNRSRNSQESQTSTLSNITDITTVSITMPYTLDRPTLKDYADSPPDYDTLNYNTLPSYGEAINKLKEDLKIDHQKFTNFYI